MTSSLMSSLIIEGEPIAKARPRLGANGNIYTPKTSKDYENMIAWCAKQLPRFEGGLLVEATFYCSPHRRMPDLDNLIKSLLDGLQKGGVFEDDVQVVEIYARRRLDKAKPRVELSLVSL